MHLPDQFLENSIAAKQLDFNNIPLQAKIQSYKWMQLKCMVQSKMLNNRGQSKKNVIEALRIAEQHLLNSVLEQIQEVLKQ